MGTFDPKDASWLTKLKAVHASAESHIREEEQDIFPRIGKAWDKNKLKQVRTEMKEEGKQVEAVTTTVRRAA